MRDRLYYNCRHMLLMLLLLVALAAVPCSSLLVPLSCNPPQGQHIIDSSTGTGKTFSLVNCYATGGIAIFVKASATSPLLPVRNITIIIENCVDVWFSSYDVQAIALQVIIRNLTIARQSSCTFSNICGNSSVVHLRNVVTSSVYLSVDGMHITNGVSPPLNVIGGSMVNSSIQLSNLSRVVASKWLTYSFVVLSGVQCVGAVFSIVDSSASAQNGVFIDLQNSSWSSNSLVLIRNVSLSVGAAGRSGAHLLVASSTFMSSKLLVDNCTFSSIPTAPAIRASFLFLSNVLLDSVVLCKDFVLNVATSSLLITNETASVVAFWVENASCVRSSLRIQTVVMLANSQPTLLLLSNSSISQYSTVAAIEVVVVNRVTVSLIDPYYPLFISTRSEITDDSTVALLLCSASPGTSDAVGLAIVAKTHFRRRSSLLLSNCTLMSAPPAGGGSTSLLSYPLIYVWNVVISDASTFHVANCTLTTAASSLTNSPSTNISGIWFENVSLSNQSAVSIGDSFIHTNRVGFMWEGSDVALNSNISVLRCAIQSPHATGVMFLTSTIQLSSRIILDEVSIWATNSYAIIVDSVRLLSGAQMVYAYLSPTSALWNSTAKTSVAKAATAGGLMRLTNVTMIQAAIVPLSSPQVWQLEWQVAESWIASAVRISGCSLSESVVVIGGVSSINRIHSVLGAASAAVLISDGTVIANQSRISVVVDNSSTKETAQIMWSGSAVELSNAAIVNCSSFEVLGKWNITTTADSRAELQWHPTFLIYNATISSKSRIVLRGININASSQVAFGLISSTVTDGALILMENILTLSNTFAIVQIGLSIITNQSTLAVDGLRVLNTKSTIEGEVRRCPTSVGFSDAILFLQTSMSNGTVLVLSGLSVEQCDGGLFTAMALALDNSSIIIDNVDYTVTNNHSNISQMVYIGEDCLITNNSYVSVTNSTLYRVTSVMFAATTLNGSSFILVKNITAVTLFTAIWLSGEFSGAATIVQIVNCTMLFGASGTRSSTGRMPTGFAIDAATLRDGVALSIERTLFRSVVDNSTKLLFSGSSVSATNSYMGDCTISFSHCTFDIFCGNATSCSALQTRTSGVGAAVIITPTTVVDGSSTSIVVLNSMIVRGSLDSNTVWIAPTLTVKSRLAVIISDSSLISRQQDGSPSTQRNQNPYLSTHVLISPNGKTTPSSTATPTLMILLNNLHLRDDVSFPTDMTAIRISTSDIKTVPLFSLDLHVKNVSHTFPSTSSLVAVSSIVLDFTGPLLSTMSRLSAKINVTVKASTFTTQNASCVAVRSGDLKLLSAISVFVSLVSSECLNVVTQSLLDGTNQLPPMLALSTTGAALPVRAAPFVTFTIDNVTARNYGSVFECLPTTAAATTVLSTCTSVVHINVYCSYASFSFHPLAPITAAMLRPVREVSTVFPFSQSNSSIRCEGALWASTSITETIGDRTSSLSKTDGQLSHSSTWLLLSKPPSNWQQAATIASGSAMLVVSVMSSSAVSMSVPTVGIALLRSSMQLASSSNCGFEEDDPSQQPPFASDMLSNPLGVHIPALDTSGEATSYAYVVGCPLGNIGVLAIVAIACIVWDVSMQGLRRCRIAAEASRKDANLNVGRNRRCLDSVMRNSTLPSPLLLPYTLLLQSSIGCAAVVAYLTFARNEQVGWVWWLYVLAVSCVWLFPLAYCTYWFATTSFPLVAIPNVPSMAVPAWQRFLMPRWHWKLPETQDNQTNAAEIVEQRFKSIYEPYARGFHWFSCVELLASVLLSGLSAIRTVSTNCMTELVCGWCCFGVVAVLIIVVVARRPYSAPLDFVSTLTNSIATLSVVIFVAAQLKVAANAVVLVQSITSVATCLLGAVGAVSVFLRARHIIRDHVADSPICEFPVLTADAAGSSLTSLPSGGRPSVTDRVVNLSMDLLIVDWLPQEEALRYLIDFATRMQRQRNKSTQEAKSRREQRLI